VSDPITQGIRRGAFVFGFLKAWKLNRKANKKAKRVALDEVAEDFNQQEDLPMAIDLGTRTSTNAVVGGGILGVVYVNLVEILPWPTVVAALTTPEMVSLVSVLLAGIVARFSKTPAVPGKL
jgi:hypothetical protein